MSEDEISSAPTVVPIGSSGESRDLSALENNSNDAGYNYNFGVESAPVDFNAETHDTAPIPSNTVKYTDIEQIKQHRNLIQKLRGYSLSSFARKGTLAEFDFSSLKEKSIEELETMLGDVKFCVGMSNSSTFSVDAFKYAMFGIETAVTASKIGDLTGFTASMLATPNMDLYLEELALDWQDYTAMRPSYKIGLIAVQKAIQVNIANQEKSAVVGRGRDCVSDRAKKLGEDL